MNRVLDWVGVGALILMFVKILLVASAPIHDPDTFFHLRLGDELGWPWQWVHVDHWSSAATADWVPTQPLTEVVQAGADQVGGLPLVAWAYGLTLVGFAVTVYWIARTHGSPMGAGFATILATAGAADSLSPRPQTLGLIFLIVVVQAWLRTADDLRPRWWLVAFFWVYALVHGYWVIGAAVGFGVVAALVLFGRARGREALRLALLSVACLAATVVTPLGPKLLEGPFNVRERTFLVVEWQGTFSDTADYLAAAAVLLPLLALALRQRLTVGYLAILAMAGFWVLYSSRTADAASVMTAPAVAASLDALRSSRPAHIRHERWIVAGGAATVLLALALVVPHTAAHESDRIPLGLNPKLDSLPQGTRVFTDIPAGDWLSWRHRTIDASVDGMLDAYPVDYLRRMSDALNARPGWKEAVAGTHAQYALLPERGALAPRLRNDGWTVIGRDEGYALLSKP